MFSLYVRQNIGPAFLGTLQPAFNSMYIIIRTRNDCNDIYCALELYCCLAYYHCYNIYGSSLWPLYILNIFKLYINVFTVLYPVLRLLLFSKPIRHFYGTDDYGWTGTALLLQSTMAHPQYYKLLPLNYFPYSFSINNTEIGMKQLQEET